jgi:hypothetical protein
MRQRGEAHFLGRHGEERVTFCFVCGNGSRGEEPP